jgi:hypothetical protein
VKVIGGRASSKEASDVHNLPPEPFLRISSNNFDDRGCEKKRRKVYMDYKKRLFIGQE